MDIFSSLDFLSSVDDGLVIYLNSFARRSWTADEFIWVVTNNSLFKGALVMTAYWWAWFRSPQTRTEPERHNPRDTLLYVLLICVPLLLLTRLMASLLPFRVRPLHNPLLHLKIAFTMSPEEFEGWSSFPSDHAVLFSALAAGLYLVSRRLGLWMYLYTAIFILLPRVYLGIHYPSDIVVGALLGLAAAFCVRIVALRRMVNWPAEWLLERSPGWFYASLFQLSYLTASLYDPLRRVAREALSVVRALIGHL
jgi:undecaprenyl-diphosphatase